MPPSTTEPGRAHGAELWGVGVAGNPPATQDAANRNTAVARVVCCLLAARCTNHTYAIFLESPGYKELYGNVMGCQTCKYTKTKTKTKTNTLGPNTLLFERWDLTKGG